MAVASKNGSVRTKSTEDSQRWTAKRRAALVLRFLRGETSAQEATRKHDLTVADVGELRDRFLLVADNALCSRPTNEDVLKDEKIKKLERTVGQLVTDLESFKEATKLRPFPAETSDE